MKGNFQYLVGGAQDGCLTPYAAQDGPTTETHFVLNVSVDDLEQLLARTAFIEHKELRISFNEST